MIPFHQNLYYTLGLTLACSGLFAGVYAFKNYAPGNGYDYASIRKAQEKQQPE